MKKLLSIVLCAVLLLGALGVPALAVNAEDYTDLPVAPQVEAGLTTTFQTWPRGCFQCFWDVWE